MNAMQTLNIISAGIDLKQKRLGYAASAALGKRAAEERERLNNNDHDFYHFAPKLLEMIAFERGEMP